MATAWSAAHRSGLVGALSRTPLVLVPSISRQTNCNVFAKLEFLLPGGSVKDRAALAIVSDALEKQTQNKRVTQAAGSRSINNSSSMSDEPPFTVVEGTAGNTGIGLCIVNNARGFKTVVFMPNTQSREKVHLLRNLGAKVIEVPAVPVSDPNHFTHQARKYAETYPNHAFGDQFDNLANRNAHYTTTGPEIWEQMNGKLDAFTCATGTGGTFAGVSQYLREASSGKVRCTVADPPGSVLYKYFTEGKLEREGDGSITEGIGQGRITGNMLGVSSDSAIHVPDGESVKMVFQLLHQDGFFVGASSALNAVAARDLALQMGPGHTIVTILCDTAQRYQSRLFSKSWLESKGVLQHVPEEYYSSLSD